MVVHRSGELHEVEAEQREPYARDAEAEPGGGVEPRDHHHDAHARQTREVAEGAHTW